MRTSFRSRIAWTVCGFALGYGFAVVERVWQLWPIQEDTSLIFLRWLGKTSIKFVIIAIIIVLTVQLLNILLTFIRDYQTRRDS